jgi:hypothetical protein
MRRLFFTMAVLLTLTACGLAPSTPVTTAPSDPGTLLSERVPNPRAFGDPNAPIVMREFSDYQ